MIILPCLEIMFAGGYLTYIFLLMFVFSLIFCLIRRITS